MYAILFPYLLLLWCCEVIHEMDQWISSLNFSFYPSQWDKVAAKPCNGKLDWKSDFCTHHWWDWNYSSWSSASQPITFSQSHLFINSLIFFSMADTKIHTAMIHLANCTLLWRQELLPLDPCQVISKCPWARGYIFFIFFISFFANPYCIMQISRTDWNILWIPVASWATCSLGPWESLEKTQKWIFQSCPGLGNNAQCLNVALYLTNSLTEVMCFLEDGTGRQ